MAEFARISGSSYNHQWMTHPLQPNYRKSLCGMMYHVDRLLPEDPKIRLCKQCKRGLIRHTQGKEVRHE